MMLREDLLSEKMKQEAIDLGLCRQWTEEWQDGTTKDEMVEKFVTGIDFCIKHDWPSPDFMQREFGDVMHSHGVYANEPVRAENAPVVVLNGDCRCEALYEGCSTGDIYVRHVSTLHLRVRFLAKVFVEMYDDCRVTIDAEEGTKVFVYRHGGEIVSAKGDIVVRERKMRYYL